MELEDWLRSVGLERYRKVFQDNEVDFKVLPTLTVEDLKDLGVNAVGDRRKFLNAIASLRTETVANQRLFDSDLTIGRSERRRVTVLFCDLVGSTALAATMDPEDLHKLLAAYRRCLWEIVHRFDGFVGKFTGDGVLACFGYPDAHEDDAERAVQAGLEVVSAVSALDCDSIANPCWHCDRFGGRRRFGRLK